MDAAREERSFDQKNLFLYAWRREYGSNDLNERKNEETQKKSIELFKNETTHLCVFHSSQNGPIKTQQILNGDRRMNGINEIAKSITRKQLRWMCF